MSNNLASAAAAGDCDAAEQMISQFVNKANGVDRCTPLHVALTHGHWKVAQLLVKKGADVKAKNWAGDTPLHVAASVAGTPNDNDVGAVQVAQLLLESGADANATNDSGTTPLHVCRDVELAKVLLENGAAVNATDCKGVTPLHLALDRKHEGVARLLLDRGADVAAKTNDGVTPLHVVAAAQQAALDY